MAMTFAQELQHAIAVEPVLDSYPMPMRPPAEASEEELAAWRVAFEAWRESRVPKPRDPGLVRVLEVEEGFEHLLAVCRAKKLFDRPMWQEMGFAGTDGEQLQAFLARKCPDPAQAALWTQGTYFRLLVRTESDVAYSALSVGFGMTEENRQECYRALYDVGIRELRNHARPDNPHTQTMLAMGHFEFEPTGDGRYLAGRRVFAERP
jgi:hypothetical protein